LWFAREASNEPLNCIGWKVGEVSKESVKWGSLFWSLVENDRIFVGRTFALWAGLDEDAAEPRTPGDIRCFFRRLEAPGGKKISYGSFAVRSILKDIKCICGGNDARSICTVVVALRTLAQ